VREKYCSFSKKYCWSTLECTLHTASDFWHVESWEDGPCNTAALNHWSFAKPSPSQSLVWLRWMSLIHSQVKIRQQNWEDDGWRLACLVDTSHVVMKDWVPPPTRAANWLSPYRHCDQLNLAGKSMLVTWWGHRLTSRNLELWKQLWSGGALNAETISFGHFGKEMVPPRLPWRQETFYIPMSKTCHYNIGIFGFHFRASCQRNEYILFCLPVLTSEQAVVTDLPSSLKMYIQKKNPAKYNQQAWKAAGCWHRTIN